VKPVEQALVDDRSPNGLPKKPSCDEAGSSTEKVEQSANRHIIQNEAKNTIFFYSIYFFYPYYVTRLYYTMFYIFILAKLKSLWQFVTTPIVFETNKIVTIIGLVRNI
jgi:hypothetical protein